MSELQALESNDNTAALAALPDLLAYTQEVSENMIGSGESHEEIAEKKAEEEKLHQESIKKAKEAEKKKAVEAVKAKARKKKERQALIEKKFQELKTQHGGLTGHEDTGYDNDAMDAYISAPSAKVQMQDDIDVNLMIADHHQKMLYEDLYTQDWDYWPNLYLRCR